MKILLITALFLITLPIVKADADKSEKAEATNIGCAADAKAANCGDKKVGTGLLKCIGDYRKANKSYKVSDKCAEATKNMKPKKAFK